MEPSQKSNMEQTMTEVQTPSTQSKELLEKSLTKTGNPEGRPPKYTDEIVKSLVKSFEDGSTITEACNIAGISRQCYYDWMRNHEEFSDKITIAQEYPDYVARSLVVRAMKNGDVDTGKWWLERKLKKEFAPKQETDITSGGKPIPILGGITKEEDD